MGSMQIPISISSSVVKNSFTDEAKRVGDSRKLSRRMQVILSVFIMVLPMCRSYAWINKNSPVAGGVSTYPGG
jgi:hypothetical protein